MISLNTMVFAVSCDKAPFMRTVRWRTVANTLSIEFVTGMKSRRRCLAAVFGIAAYGVTIRDRGAGSTKVRAGRSCTLSCELVLVVGRLCELARLRRERKSVFVV